MTSKHSPNEKDPAHKPDPDFKIDVDEALIDDQHPKDTIEGGPKDKDPQRRAPEKK